MTTLSPDTVAALRALPYAKYLFTDWWRFRRNQALRDAGFRCQRCESKRGLEVHHRSYDHLGAEPPEDLEVLCRGCHLGEHYNAVQDHVAVYVRVLSEVLRDRPTDAFTDLIEEAKQRCAALAIPYKPTEFHAAVSRVLPRVPFAPPTNKAELYERSQPSTPLTRGEAAGILARLGIARVIHHMPEVRPLTLRQMECRRALAIVAQAIREQAQRCDEVESEPQAPKSGEETR